MQFSQFTPEAMTAFGHELAAGVVRRAASLAETRQETRELLERFRCAQARADAERRSAAADSAEARHLFVRDLKSDVHALLSRFELHRRDTAAEVARMATTLRQARDAFRGRREPRRAPAPARAPSQPAVAPSQPDAPAPPPRSRPGRGKKHGA